MRWMTRTDEDGAVAVWVAMSLVPILLCLALVVDLGIAHWERGQLQNGADAAALAVAEDCIRDATKCSVSGAGPAAADVAAQNANDAAANATVNSFTGNSSAGTAKVTATTRTSSNTTTLELPILNEVVPGGQASASVKWGVPSRGNVIPYVIGTCEFTDARLLSGQEVVIENTNHTTCPGGSPGGFGWLDNASGAPCQITISISGWVYGDTGSWGSNSNCSSADLTPFLCSTILVPIYDRTARNPDGSGVPSGSNLYYHIEKFAAFVFDGWKKDNAHRAGCPGIPQLFGVAGRPNSGIQGHFVRFVALDESFELGPGGPSGGVITVRMTG
jgi:Flp pilus assembly protein TadG